MKAPLLLALLAMPAPAVSSIRAIFVGIDTYRFSAEHVPGAAFHDLHGTLNDVAHIKDALRTTYKLDLDPGGLVCGKNAISTTLTNECATRDAILAALDERIAQSANGDTVLFYYAGHGSQIADRVTFDQPSGKDATILPVDARDPDGLADGDLLDREILEIKNRATGKGVNFVTIFDSCHSESATRDPDTEGQARDAPALKVDDLAKHHPLPVASSSGAGGGYAVHLAASREEELAREVGDGPMRAGVFTTALAAAIRAMPGATFDDLLSETRRAVEDRGQGTQSPRGEGALTARLGGANSSVVLMRVVAVSGGLMLQAGQLSGVSMGSRFALFNGSTSALDEAATPLGIATVTRVDTNAATLTPDAAVPINGSLTAREIQHAFGTRTLLVRNSLTGGARAGVGAALIAGSAGSIGEPAQLAVVPSADGGATLKTVGGQTAAALGDPNSASFAPTLREALAKVARVNDLLALRTPASKAGITLCFSETAGAKACPALVAGARPTINAGQISTLTVTNQLLDTPRYLYVFGIDDAYAVKLLVPSGGGTDPAVTVSRPITTPIKPRTPGAYRFVSIATDAPIDAAAFQQSRAGTRGLATCATPLERALCGLSTGTRDPSSPRVGAWTAIVTDVDVE